MHASASQLALVLLLIGWKGGANLLSQSHRVESAKPITFRHSNENRSKGCKWSCFPFPTALNKYLLTNYVQRSTSPGLLTRRAAYHWCGAYENLKLDLAWPREPMPSLVHTVYPGIEIEVRLPSVTGLTQNKIFPVTTFTKRETVLVEFLSPFTLPSFH